MPEVALVKSQNFEFLRATHPELASLGGHAEQYAHPDAPAALGKLRVFGEQVVEIVYAEGRLSRPYNANQFDLLNDATFRRIVPEVVQTKLHFVRKLGNDAVHNNRGQASDALRALREAFEIAQWFQLAIVGKKTAASAVFRPPVATVPEGASAERLEKEKRQVQELLAAREAQLAKLLADLEIERQKRAAAEALGLKSREELAAKLEKAGEEAANVLALDELTTRRRYIDEALTQAGWHVGDDGVDTEHVGQEVKVTGLKNATGSGSVDYVLWGDDGKPLAVVEAKRASIEMEQGREQARKYADCLEQKHGVRPLIFYTNGIDIGLWDDAQKAVPRTVHGFYSKDSLEHLHFKRQKTPLARITPRPEIAGRMYQLEAIKRVCERFTDGHRRALVVQATGTGKTRVAISLCDVMLSAKWAERILFLCDRRELRRQASNVFNEFLPGEPRIVVSAKMTPEDRTKHRIFLATYPAMMERFEDFDVGFFDLIIADESHRSIYNKFRDIFVYFDALQVGLTATPIRHIDRNTFSLFGCEDQSPTSNFTYTEAIEHKPPYLVDFRVLRHTTRFLREGIKYADLPEAEREALDHGEDIAPEALDREVFNVDTTRKVWAELMDHGIRDASGMRPGKTILFARSHAHAMHLEEVFHETYPQHGGTFCRVIDNKEPKAEQLIDDFKDKANDLTVAISVDMLDTGIDVPEVVNLVFAKPVRSYVKFWQMIGRGTRLCPDLFGPGRHKTEFLINDHWGNFEYFSEKYVEKTPAPARSLLQNLFDARLELASAALDAMDDAAFQKSIDLIRDDVVALDRTKSFAVKERWKAVEKLKDRTLLEAFSAATRADLKLICGPLMKERNITGDEDAYRFDLLVTLLQTERLRGSPRADDYRARVEEAAESLPKNLTPVKAKKDAILQVRDKAFWKKASFTSVEALREDLRGVMKHCAPARPGHVEPLYLDLADGGVKRDSYVPTFDKLELVAYRKRVEAVIASHLKDHPVLQKVKANKRVSEEELETMSRLILDVDDRANLKHLAANTPETRNSLLYTLRGIVGLDAQAVDAAFNGFVQTHKLTSTQIRFLSILKNLIAKNGGLEIDRLYEDPFTTVHPQGLDGVFTDPRDADDLATILAAFTPAPESRNAS